MSIEKANVYFNITSYIWQAAIGAFAGGFITAAIGALFLMRK
jgi:hypothetical protein